MVIDPQKNTPRSNPHLTTLSGMDAYIKLKELPPIVKRSPASIYRDEKNGLFPKRRRIGKSAVAWLRSEVEAWLSSREVASGVQS